MNRREFIATVAGGTAVGLAGCVAGEGPDGREAGSNVGISDDNTNVDIEGEQAVWTWTGEVHPTFEAEPCSVTLHLALYDDGGTLLEEKTTVLRSVYSGGETRTVTIVTSPEVVNQISTYEVNVESKQCRGTTETETGTGDGDG